MNKMELDTVGQKMKFLGLMNNKAIFYYTVLMCSLLSVFFTFIDVVLSRVLFFIAGYISIFVLVLFRPKIERRYWGVFAAIFLLGASKLLWVGIEYIGNPDYNKYNAYMATGKRIVLSSIVAWVLFSLWPMYREKSGGIIKCFLISSFLCASCVGTYQYFIDIPRVDFYLGRATDAAYMYSALAIMVIFVFFYDFHNKINLTFGFLTFLVAYAVIFATGTRNVIASFPLIIIFVGVFNFRHLGIKTFIGFILILGLSVGAGYSSFIKPKIDATLHEVNTFDNNQGNISGSLTSRLAMWRVGTASFIAHPMGASLEERTSWSEKYVESTNRDRSALPFMSVHLHNEIIETASLQGLQGLAVLFFLYIVLLANALRKRNALLMAVTLTFIFSGLTDVMFISREQSIFFTLMIILSVLWHKDKDNVLS